jgi:hypothetical protein
MISFDPVAFSGLVQFSFLIGNSGIAFTVCSV